MRWFQFSTIVFSIITSILYGCSTVQQRIEAMKPEIRGTTVAWGRVTDAQTEVLATVKVYNPNAITLPVKKVSFGIAIAGVNLGSAETKDLSIEKNAEFPINITALINNREIPKFWAEHLRHSEKSEAVVDLKATFDLKISEFTFPFTVKQPVNTNLLAELSKVGPQTVEKKFRMPITGNEQTVFKVTVDSLSGKWGNINPESTELVLKANLRNENAYPLVVPKIGVDVKMNNVPLGSGEVAANYVILPKTSKEISPIINLQTGRMDRWFVTHIQQKEKSTFSYSVTLLVDLPGDIAQMLGASIGVPVWSGSASIQTDILGTSGSR